MSDNELEAFEDVKEAEPGQGDANLDLQDLSEKDLNAVLLDANLYDDMRLVNVAFSLLVTQYQQRERLSAALGRVHVLVDDESIKVWGELKSSLSVVRKLADTTETWAELQEPEHIDSHAELCSILRRFTTLCAKSTAEPQSMQTISEGSGASKASESREPDGPSDERRPSTLRGPAIPGAVPGSPEVQGSSSASKPAATSKTPIRRGAGDADEAGDPSGPVTEAAPVLEPNSNTSTF